MSIKQRPTVSLIDTKTIAFTIVFALTSTIFSIAAYAQIIRWDLAVLKPSQHGSLTVYKFFACEDWRRAAGTNPLDTPSRGPEWPLLCDTTGTASGLTILYYRGDRFTASNGAPRQPPIRWAYVRLAEDVWNGSSHHPPGVEATQPVTMDLDATMRWLSAQGHSKKAVMDAMDRVTWTDGTGSPE